MWISSISLGYKKILLYLALSLCVWVVPLPQEVFIQGLILVGWIYIGRVAYTHGVFIKRQSFISSGESFDLVDYYSFTNHLDSKREIRHPKSNLVESSMYLSVQPRWVYFDFIRRMLAHSLVSNRKAALVLGGGGGSVSMLLIRDIQFERVDMVEISREMVHIARSWFLPKHMPELRIFTQDAIAFIAKSKNAYNFIFVDVFRGKDIDRNFFRAQTMRSLKQRLLRGGLLVINFGPGFNKVVEKAQAHFHGMVFLTHRGSLIGMWPNQKRFTALLNT